MRISSGALLTLTLAACSAGAPDKDDRGETIACALDGAADFAQACSVERARASGGLMLIVRHPNGGFRRLQVTSDGRGVVAADGADAVASALAGGLLEVSIDGDRYRLPVTVAKAERAAPPPP